MREHRLEKTAMSPIIEGDDSIPLSFDVPRNASIRNNDTAPVQILTFDGLPVCVLHPGQVLRYRLIPQLYT